MRELGCCSGGYQLPSEATHQLGPCGASLTLSPSRPPQCQGHPQPRSNVFHTEWLPQGFGSPLQRTVNLVPPPAFENGYIGRDVELGRQVGEPCRNAAVAQPDEGQVLSKSGFRPLGVRSTGPDGGENNERCFTSSSFSSSAVMLSGLRYPEPSSQEVREEPHLREPRRPQTSSHLHQVGGKQPMDDGIRRRPNLA